MKLHTQPKKVRDRMVALGTFSFDGLTMEAYRNSIDDLIPLAGTPQTVKEILHKQISGADGDISINIYVPNKLLSKGALVYFAGHGFVYGNIKQQDIVCRALANVCGCKIINVIARSAPEYQFPVGLNDSYEGLKWTVSNAKSLDLDTNKIGICGESSGANFAAVCAIRARDEGIPLTFQILISPPLDLTMSMPSYKKYGHNYLLDVESVEWIFKKYVPEKIDRKNPELSPLFAKNLKGLPNTLIINAECDPLVDEGLAYAQKLREAGVKVTRSLYEGQMHNFVIFRGEYPDEKDPIDEVGHYVASCFE